MKIILTAGEAINKGIWDKICELKGYNPWCVNEGLMDSDDEIKLTSKEAKKIGLISNENINSW